jgi:hypothetical protein
MFLDPNKLDQYSPAEILKAGSLGHLGLDHRFLRTLLDRPDVSLPAVLKFADRDRSRDAVDLGPELVALLRFWKTPEAVPFLVRYIAEDPTEVPDEAVEALVQIGLPALEPLLELYKRLDEEASGDIAFILANLGIRDERIREVLEARMEYDLSDAVLQLGIYGDPAGLPALDRVEAELGERDADLKKEIAEARETIARGRQAGFEEDTFDIWALYPEEADVPVDLLDDDQRLELLKHPIEAVRRAAASSFFNRELSQGQKAGMLRTAQQDLSAAVRARAWEALTTSTDEEAVLEAMLTRMRGKDVPVEERGGLMVGLSSEADRNEVRAAINDLYNTPGGQAKAIEAMWRSMHPSFHDNFAKHLSDEEVEVKRGAVWGIGYYGVKSELAKIRALFDDEELRSDALFAYALALPGEASRGRMTGLLARIEKDASGLTEMEEELVKAALDERLLLAGKEPFFAQQED